jgi:hypothetical protein
MSFFSSVRAAADWLCQTTARGPDGPICPAALTAAAERVREIDAAPDENRRHARSFRIGSA